MNRSRMSNDELYDLALVVTDVMNTTDKLYLTMFDNDTMTDEWIHEFTFMELELTQIRKALYDQVVEEI